MTDFYWTLGWLKDNINSWQDALRESHKKWLWLSTATEDEVAETIQMIGGLAGSISCGCCIYARKINPHTFCDDGNCPLFDNDCCGTLYDIANDYYCYWCEGIDSFAIFQRAARDLADYIKDKMERK